jgi:L-asparaginase
MSRRVLILYTGGTFGMVEDKKAKGAPSPLRISDRTPAELKRWFLKRVPEMPEIARCDVEILLNRDSAHVGPEDWIMLAKRIQLAWKQYDGVVVLHGTDTLPYTAAALSFLLRPCKKPVVLTGAQKPLSSLRTDARRNMISSIEIAATASSSPDPRVAQGVTVFFDHLLFQGNRVRKRSASEFEGFESPKFPPLAEVGTKIRYLLPGKDETNWPKSPKIQVEAAFSEKVVHLHMTPAFPARRLLDLALGQLDGILLQVFLSGTGPTHLPGVREFLESAARRKVPVVLVADGHSYEKEGGANPGNYAAGKVLLEHGAVWAGSMTPECAFVKTSLILAQPDGKDRFRKLWNADLAGEF